MKQSWKDAPDWANWRAMDYDGEWTWFAEDPRPDAEFKIWTVPGYYAQHAGFSEPSEDWMDTKEKRPDETP